MTTQNKSNLYPSLEELMIDTSLSNNIELTLTKYPQLMSNIDNNNNNNENYELTPVDPVLKYISIFKEKTQENYKKALVKEGVREIILYKNQQGKVGLSFQLIDMGLFISLVEKESSASLAGIRFGEQLLAINNEPVAGLQLSQIYKIFSDIPIGNQIKLIFRDRPYAKIYNLTKDNTGYFGFTFTRGNINNIIKDSSSAKNGLQIDHQIIEINGQNVIGFSDDELTKIFKNQPAVITITVMEKSFYKKMIVGINLKDMSHIFPQI
jgi:syntenin-1